MTAERVEAVTSLHRPDLRILVLRGSDHLLAVR
eukprot:CAMPEP_0115239206 /NCGR_PEP_ID=MMETSP0270-20121206/37279_1 /TAXON_ID=71861 /ORGANISM="Scrippsiella trochoidea, Strain CCMP3099" /LENGTH=32 /DNA_ID= /DNA_START= /DNA_END= /DNA_ORIENTATION=